MRYIIYGVSFVAMLGMQGCQDLTGNQLPTGTPDPETIKTAAGARGLAAIARQSFHKAISSTIFAGGLMTDELQALYRGSPATGLGSEGGVLIDSRHLNTGEDIGFTRRPYANLHLVRRDASQAISALTRYAPETSANLRGMLYTSMAYAELWLADLFCSGVPLSTLDYGEDWTLKAGSKTDEVYLHAIQLFDSAIALAADSIPVQHLAHIGKARALLALGEYTQLETVLADVPDDFLYTEQITTCKATKSSCDLISASIIMELNATVATSEGGQHVIDPTNPRTEGVLITLSGDLPVLYFPVYHPVQYAQDGVSTIVVASGREAQLIRAEAALHANQPGRMFDILNSLRAADPRTSSLPPMTDPGAATRLDTLFSERGQWLFLSGHRQGDLRRLVRNYDRPQQTVYPSGPYPGGIVSYGSDVTLPIWGEDANPKFRGCLNREA